MTRSTRALCVVSWLLVLAVAWIVYREAGLRHAADTPNEATARQALAAQARAEADALAARQQAETERLKVRLDAAVAETGVLRARLETESARTLERKRRTARGSRAGLVAEVSVAATAQPGEVSADDTHVWLARRAALAWLDRSLQLQREVELAPARCAERLAERERALVPPLVAARQACERRENELQSQLRERSFERDNAERQRRAEKGETLQWGLIGAASGLVVGAVATGFLIHYIKR